MNNGGPAFPGEKSVRFGQTNDCNEGMTLRDYFAAKAMQSYMAHVTASGLAMSNAHQEIAEEAYAIADAMLSAREKT